MPWNPDVYDQFKQERSAPYFDLIKLIEVDSVYSVIDLGCGTGELTSGLTEVFPSSKITGIDSSAEMLQKAGQFATDRLQFFHRSIEKQAELEDQFDLIVANASLQWCENHEDLFPKLISKLNTEGQLAVQVPSNHNFIVHQLLSVVADHDVYQKHFNGWRREYSVLDIEDYAKILSDNGGKKINVFEKVYPHIMKDADAVFDWASGTAMIPFIERLPDDLKEQYKDDYREELRKVFTGSPVFYPFKRTFIYAQF